MVKQTLPRYTAINLTLPLLSVFLAVGSVSGGVTDKILCTNITEVNRFSEEMEANFSGTEVILTPVVQNPPEVKMSVARIIKNLLVVSFGFLCLFTSFQSLINLQSSLNKQDGLGVAGLAVIYGALVVSCMFSPPFIISRLGCKWTVFASMLSYILYMAANFYPVWSTIIPSAINLGFGAAPLWTAKCTYLTEIATWYAKQTGATVDDIINRIFGIFFMFLQTSQIWGNLISTLVFRKSENRNGRQEDLLTCGADFCPTSDVNNTNLDRPDMDRVYKVCGTYIGCAVLAVIVIAVGLDPITLDREDGKNRKFSLHLMFETAKHLWRSNYQKLLVILTMYSGVEQAFAAGDYTKSFVACALGIEYIGFVMICYGAVDAICSFLFGRLVQFVGHIPFFILAFLLHGGLQITFLLWKPNSDQVYLFYIFAALWGIGDAVIQTQINALYGMLWTKDSEAAFANYRLWESIGFIIAFACQDFLCTNIKIYICLGILSVGMLLYGVVEIAHRRDEILNYNVHIDTRFKKKYHSV